MNTPPPSTGAVAAEALAAMNAEIAGLRQADGGTVADTLAGWLATRYVIAARQLAKEAGDSGIDLPTLAKLTADVVALRKGDHSAERLRIERERGEERMQARFEEWLKQPGMVERICGPRLTPEEKEARMRSIFGLGPRVSRGLSPESISEIEKAIRIL